MKKPNSLFLDTNPWKLKVDLKILGHGVHYGINPP